MRILISVSSFTSGDLLEKMKADGCEVVVNPYGRRMTEDEIMTHLPGFDGVIAGLEPLNDKVLRHAKGLKAIARIGIGVDNVDLNTAKELGIKVSNTPDAPTKSVAEITVAALMTIAYNFIPSNADLHNGIWKKRKARLLEELSVLIVGYGRIGKATAEMLKRFGCKIVVFDPFIPAYAEPDLKEKLGRADVVTLHAASPTEILTPEMFGCLKKGAIILNSARGHLINEEALVTALNDGTVSGFWGDAFVKEPYEGHLQQCENAVLTPHISTNNATCRRTMETEAVSNVLRDLAVE